MPYFSWMPWIINTASIYALKTHTCIQLVVLLDFPCSYGFLCCCFTSSVETDSICTNVPKQYPLTLPWNVIHFMFSDSADVKYNISTLQLLHLYFPHIYITSFVIWIFTLIMIGYIPNIHNIWIVFKYNSLYPLLSTIFTRLLTLIKS